MAPVDGPVRVQRLLDLDDGDPGRRPDPQLFEITDAAEPDEPFRTNFATMLRVLAEDSLDDSRFAFLISRPGTGALTLSDRQWASALYAVSRAAGIVTEVVHLASVASIRPIPPDDLESLASSA